MPELRTGLGGGAAPHSLATTLLSESLTTSLSRPHLMNFWMWRWVMLRLMREPGSVCSLTTLAAPAG